MAGELAFQLRGMRLVLRARTQDDTALLETTLVFGSAILRNACPNQRADERPRGAACAGTRDGPRDRARDDEAQTWNGDRGRRGDQCTERCADSETNPTTNTSALGCLGAFLNSCPGFTSPKWRFACRLTSPH